MDKSYSEQMEEQLEPRPERRTVVLIGTSGFSALVADILRSEFFPVPTVHETWIRNRIPRGAHYDPADDGPETGIITREMRCRVEDFFDHWLSNPPKPWDDGPVDTLDHRRE